MAGSLWWCLGVCVCLRALVCFEMCVWLCVCLSLCISMPCTALCINTHTHTDTGAERTQTQTDSTLATRLALCTDDIRSKRKTGQLPNYPSMMWDKHKPPSLQRCFWTIRWRVEENAERKQRHGAASHLSNNIHKQGTICFLSCWYTKLWSRAVVRLGHHMPNHQIYSANLSCVVTELWNREQTGEKTREWYKNVFQK